MCTSITSRCSCLEVWPQWRMMLCVFCVFRMLTLTFNININININKVVCEHGFVCGLLVSPASRFGPRMKVMATWQLACRKNCGRHSAALQTILRSSRYPIAMSTDGRSAGGVVERTGGPAVTAGRGQPNRKRGGDATCTWGPVPLHNAIVLSAALLRPTHIRMPKRQRPTRRRGCGVGGNWYAPV